MSVQRWGAGIRWCEVQDSVRRSDTGPLSNRFTAAVSGKYRVAAVRR